MNPIGIMQGRLLPPLHNKIQSFPSLKWQQEFLTASRLSLDCIEFIFDGADIHSHPLLTGTGRGEIRYLMNRYNIRVYSVCADYFMKYPLHTGNRIRIPESVRLLTDLVTCCSYLGIRTIVLPCVDSSSITCSRDLLLLKHNLAIPLRTAGRLGMQIALETDLPPDKISSLLALIDSPSLQINYDSGNSASLGYDPAREINQYGSWVCDVHIKDRILGGQTVPLGKGDTRFDDLFSSLHDIRYTGPFILQAARGERGHEVATIQSQLSFLERYQ